MLCADDLLNARILIVDDQQANVRLLEQMLGEAGYRCITSTMDPQAVCALHRDNHYDLILLDLQMPGMDGFQVMEGLKEIEADGYLPVLVITAQPGHKLQALTAGAKDFISKPFDLVEVKTRIHNMLEVRLLYKQLEQYSRALESMALHDALTGLPNRRLLMDRLSLAIAHARRNTSAMAVMFLDLDGFKQINDTLGHAVGDLLLQSVAQRLSSCVRGSDTVSRQGGDEFVVLLGDLATSQDAAQSAQKLVQVLSEPHLLDGHRVNLTVSLGLTTFPDDGDDAATLVRNADAAMYDTKRQGRNGCRAFTPAMNARAVAQQSIEQALRQGLELGQFELHYQPKVNLQTRAVTGAEALLRLRQGGELIAPPFFLRVAETSGLIIPIGRWVLRQACQQMAAWLAAGHALGQMAVNVSAIEFHRKDFVANVQSALKDSGLEPHRLELELTETGLIRDLTNTTHTLQELERLGVRVAIDNFGVGYSCLSSLRALPIATLKIDQSFVQEIQGAAGNRVVSAVIALGSALGHRVVAEGVESREQLEFLRARGCEEGQGYWLGPPVTAEEFAR